MHESAASSLNSINKTVKGVRKILASQCILGEWFRGGSSRPAEVGLRERGLLRYGAGRGGTERLPPSQRPPTRDRRGPASPTCSVSGPRPV